MKNLHYQLAGAGVTLLEGAGRSATHEALQGLVVEALGTSDTSMRAIKAWTFNPESFPTNRSANLANRLIGQALLLLDGSNGNNGHVEARSVRGLLAQTATVGKGSLAAIKAHQSRK